MLLKVQHRLEWRHLTAYESDFLQNKTEKSKKKCWKYDQLQQSKAKPLTGRKQFLHDKTIFNVKWFSEQPFFCSIWSLFASEDTVSSLWVGCLETLFTTASQRDKTTSLFKRLLWWHLFKEPVVALRRVWLVARGVNVEPGYGAPSPSLTSPGASLICY